KLTVARYFTPNGISIQAEGIKPDVEVPNVDPELFQKAITNRPTRREIDIKGHLLGDKEKKKISKQKNSDSSKLWFLGTDKDDKKLTDREQLLKKDFQILQAYNYVRSWSAI